MKGRKTKPRNLPTSWQPSPVRCPPPQLQLSSYAKPVRSAPRSHPIRLVRSLGRVGCSQKQKGARQPGMLVCMVLWRQVHLCRKIQFVHKIKIHEPEGNKWGMDVSAGEVGRRQMKKKGFTFCRHCLQGRVRGHGRGHCSFHCQKWWHLQSTNSLDTESTRSLCKRWSCEASG